ncbi:MAG: GFA family protein [Alphaproteobacteria bacterium]|nr:GFA family protein [Alphaproteobacteria bacterium]
MRRTYNGSCHCGKVRFEVTADIDHVRVCDCSICRKRGALNFRVEEADLSLTTPLEELSSYQWGTRTAKDYFCPTCGILPFRRPRHTTAAELGGGTKPFTGWAINIRCLDDVDIFSLPQKIIHGSKL